MAQQKPGIPKGTRDFGPDKMIRRNFIFRVIRETFEKYGFLPMETPALENLDVLTGKYGDEGDQLLFKILNSGDFLSRIDHSDELINYKTLTPLIAEKGLRYDLTVPFARFVVMNQHDIAFPFKRYQIQPVWRADRPQKGRYREFYQCDADVVGTDSLICEAENILMIQEVFSQLKIPDFTIKINNRKILTGLTEMIDAPGKEGIFCVAIDKLDKIGKQKVLEEMKQSGFSDHSIRKLEPVFHIAGNNLEKMDTLKQLLNNSVAGTSGIAETETILGYLNDFGVDLSNIDFDLTLARGLSYYTGAILEVKAQKSSINSSLGGGGRYDNLTGVFGLEGVSGVGFSFGVDRIYDVMEEYDIFPDEGLASTTVLITNFDDASSRHALGLLQKLRSHGIKSEIFPDSVKLKKQMNYANKKNIPFVIMVGSQEITENKYGLKNMISGEQSRKTIEEIIDQLKNQHL